ncbi:hypothetical protein [Saccharothrix sp. NRRL B-16314]|uniref:hypothetical protein n=1 Tax=Saccharothrix sp. NRRL B-16314 TaxID=1463825 RepID=UPI0005266051|nr:hypothetical protein [Saccharothrix sp. NRRL B-16314]
MGRKGRPKVRTGTSPDDVRHRPRSAEARDIPTGKRPRRAFTPSEPEGKLVVLLSRIDLDGPWCLTKISQADHRSLLSRIQSFETMTVREAFDQSEEPGKDYPIDRLPNRDARKRLEELTYDDRDEISRLRINGPGRLYGFREGTRFYALWWDPEHRIWPGKR